MPDVQSPDPRARRSGGRTARRIAAGVLAGAALLAFAPTASAADAPPEPAGAGAAEARHGDSAALDRALDALITEAGVSAALGEVRDHGRTVWRGASGQADLDTGAAARADGRFRIGSVTKTFVATVVLQLVAEHKVELDAPIERYLPGAVRGGEGITVRQLLNHTSGLYDYLGDPSVYFHDDTELGSWLTTGRWTTYQPRQLLDISGRHAPNFPPGQQWSYSNTNYVAIGMMIEKVTGRSWNQEVERRIIRPLGLDHTTMPTTSTAIPGRYAHGYLKRESGERVDVSRLNPSIAYAAGAGISTTDDLARFNAALLGGRLLRPAQLKEMTTTVPIDEEGTFGYGLGLTRRTLPCGDVWGHDGGIAGYSTILFGDLAGRHQVAISANPYEEADPARATAALDAIVVKTACGPDTPVPPAPRQPAAAGALALR
ncbi:beta-lactamase family protein [Kitasatospora sp. NBC_00240]|uniref:serine hydrolase domain-containing protein n=1 Tax=Kitasatospora sp. NBC_00240 TaxID=2903567 RepID=UPI00225A81C6|nr:serine hydrolase domain-containing protein [Kitasatospora sp. NBC_00240]MCX5213739.1 beta-lactamase family protein [Kitasatospora sp. NBC_00240]